MAAADWTKEKIDHLIDVVLLELQKTQDPTTALVLNP